MKPITFKQWQVTVDGLEVTDGSYPLIEIEELFQSHGSNDTHSEWLLHMAEKSEWVDVEDLIHAWLTAVAVHKVEVSHVNIPGSIRKAREIWWHGKVAQAVDDVRIEAGRSRFHCQNEAEMDEDAEIADQIIRSMPALECTECIKQAARVAVVDPERKDGGRGAAEVAQSSGAYIAPGIKVIC
jgi:hypothetical protein